MQIMAATLKTTNIDAQKRFYTTVLGLPLIREEAERFTVQAGITRLTWEAAEPGTAPHYHFAFNIPPNKLDEAKAWLAERHQVLKDADGEDVFHFVSWNAHSFYFHDAADHGGEFIARHNLRGETDEVFGPDQILSLSEISLPAEDVTAVYEFLAEWQGWSLFPGGRESSGSFDPIGDDEGLLLVARVGRTWMTTGGEATITPVTLTLKGPNPGQFVIPGLPYHIRVV